MRRLAARSEIDSAGSEDRSQNSGDSDDMGGHDDVGNNHASQRRGRAQRERPRLRPSPVRVDPAGRDRLFNLIYGIAAIANSHVFVANAHYVFADLRTWGWITLIIGVLQLLAAAGVMAGNQLARWFAVALLGLNAIDQMFFIPAYPFWSLTIIAVDVVALWGLCAYGSRENLAA